MTVDSCHYDAPAVLERQFWNCKTDDGHGNGQLSVFLMNQVTSLPSMDAA